MYARPVLSFERMVRQVRVDGRQTNGGHAGEENDDRGGCDRGIARDRILNGDPVRTREDTLSGRLRMPVECPSKRAGVRATLQSGSKHETEDSRHPRAVSKIITVSTPPQGE